MYKKITHTIVEEHFDHPLSTEIKKGVDKLMMPSAAAGGMPRGPKMPQRSRIPTNEIFNETAYRADAQSYVTNFSDNLNKIIDCINTSNADIVAPFEQIFTDIDKLGNMTKPFFNSELGERINSAMRSLVLLTTLSVHSANAGLDPTSLLNRLQQVVADLNAAVNSYNAQWNVGDIDTTFGSIIANIRAKVTARTNKNNVMADELSTKIYSDLIKFGNLFADGVILKFPTRFTMS